MNYLHPWNLTTFAIGLGLLIAGAGYAPDWDVPVSVLMASFTYLMAVPAYKLLRSGRWAVALLMAWWCVDGCYALYWGVVDHRVLVDSRVANGPTSFVLFLTCAVVWSLDEFAEQTFTKARKATAHLFHRRRGLDT